MRKRNGRPCSVCETVMSESVSTNILMIDNNKKQEGGRMRKKYVNIGTTFCDSERESFTKQVSCRCII